MALTLLPKAFQRTRKVAPTGATGDFTPVLYAIGIRRVLTVFCLMFTIVYFETAVTNNWLYVFEEFRNAPHILSAISALFYAIALFGGGVFKRQSRVRRMFFCFALAVPLLRIAEMAFFPSEPLSRFAEQLFGLEQADDVYMSLSTCLSFVCLSLGALLRQQWSFVAYVLTLMGTFVPSISLIAYVYNTGAAGGVAISTAVVINLLGLTQLLVFVRAPFLRHIFAGSEWGNFVRRQLAFVSVGVLILGAVTRIFFPTSSHAPEVLTAGTVWFFVLFVLITGPRYERTDHARRMLERELERQARIDPLTGLLNRRAVRSLVQSDRDRCGEAPEGVGIILADIDHFKRVNDTAGHEAGDAVLCNVAKVLRANVRGADILARWGGEEFLLLLPGADLHQTVKIAEALRTAVETSVVWTEGDKVHPITLSLGVSMFASDGAHSLEQAIQMADTALYAAKEHGRNRVEENADEAERLIAPHDMTSAARPV
ncbi:GGDEF domain-containing protein [Celeribacter sp.]|uniref:GGDEF domain-containing protein n=1 Tax=Celeribacter sp. TaxID=1890673 RepID=UPI003A941930